jgi:geranylgeranyl pyrophosphate synthase
VDVQAYLAERTPLVDAALERILPDPDSSPRALHGAMRHLIFPGGKRLRPALAMAAAEAVGAPPQAALPMATAVELVHTYSLIHDDLPCMDDDVVRRGRPTVHVSYDEAVAVLAGDALQALAFACLTADLSDPARVAAAVRDLAVAIGAPGLVGGQVDDLGFEAAVPGAAAAAMLAGKGRIAAIESIHARKTAALIAVSIVGGARLGGADDERLELLDGFGRAIGVAYQIADDLLDADEDDGCTLVREIGVAACRERAESLLVGALDAVEGMGERAEPLRELARHGVRREV